MGPFWLLTVDLANCMYRFQEIATHGNSKLVVITFIVTYAPLQNVLQPQ